MMKKLIVLVIVLLLAVGPLAAQLEPVAFAVLLFSPTCPHCHDVISNHLPGIQERFGDQLQVLFVDVSTQGGQMLAQSAYAYYQIPQENWVVPMMIIGDRVLTGSFQIPDEMPGLIESGLARGGIDLPSFPGMREAYARYLEQHPEEAPAQDLAESPDTAPPTLAERLSADPLANALAILVLAALVLSLAAVLFFRPLPERLVRGARLVSLAACLILAATLVMQGATDRLATPLAWGSLIVLVVITLLFFRRASEGLIPLVAVVGLTVAAYLAFVELTQTTAACGAVGNCNAVQQSTYAQIAGVPIGVIGLVGYAAILLTWALDRRLSGPAYRLALFVMALVGTMFSIYLTFLEPFVIGATCAWCLLSAVLMLTLLWLTAPAGWASWQQARRPAAEAV